MRLDKSQKQVISRHLLIRRTVLLRCPVPLALLAVLSTASKLVQISSEKSLGKPWPPSLSTVPSNLALRPWGWSPCSVFTARRFDNPPWGQVQASLGPSTLNAIWLRLAFTSGLSTKSHQMAFYRKIRTKSVLTSRANWKSTTETWCIQGILSLNELFPHTHSVYRCYRPQLSHGGTGEGTALRQWHWASAKLGWR